MTDSIVLLSHQENNRSIRVSDIEVLDKNLIKQYPTNSILFVESVINSMYCFSESGFNALVFYDW
tara:strand:+ start:18839 stop:19033 length:195 start_codon:yes stop_codon:yes gene_type:complete